MSSLGVPFLFDQGTKGSAPELRVCACTAFWKYSGILSAKARLEGCILKIHVSQLDKVPRKYPFENAEPHLLFQPFRFQILKMSGRFPTNEIGIFQHLSTQTLFSSLSLSLSLSYLRVSNFSKSEVVWCILTWLQLWNLQSLNQNCHL